MIKFILIILLNIIFVSNLLTGSLKRKVMHNLQFSLGTEELFAVFVKVFERNYTLSSEEGIKRYENFKKSLEFMKNKTDEEIILSLGEYSDMSHEEFKNQRLNLKMQNKKSIIKDKHNKCECDCIYKSTKVQKYEKIDWKSKLLTPRNQHSCGSCWSFSTIAAIEGQLSIKKGIKEYLSTQELLDCSKKGGNDGCNGGFPRHALEYIKRKGISKEVDYKYINSENSFCKKVDLIDKIKISGFDGCNSVIGMNDEDDIECTFDLWFNLLSKGPIVVVIDSSSEVLQHYSSGIINFNKKDCQEVNHAVLAVGYDNEVITIRNSWGADWGEGGYFRVKKNDLINNSCFITSSAYLPIL